MHTKEIGTIPFKFQYIYRTLIKFVLQIATQMCLVLLPNEFHFIQTDRGHKDGQTQDRQTQGHTQEQTHTRV